MTATSSTASSSKGGGAVPRKRTNGKAQTVEYRGLTLILKPEDEVGDLVFSISEGNISDALKTCVGLKQYDAIREKCAEAKLKMSEVVAEMRDLLDECVKSYGLNSGE